MAPNKLRVIHILAASYHSSSMKIAMPDLARVPYESFGGIADLISYLHRMHGGTNLPEERYWNKAVKLFDEQEAQGIAMFAITAPEYPKYLRRVEAPPRVLYARGNTKLLKELPGVAVVGAREVTPAGAKITRRISEFLTLNGWIIVSGLARGIDAIAHESCLDAGGKTIAVLANGLDEPQPKQNAALGYRILEEGGLWVSEHPVGTEVKPFYFKERNRIQLGLSAGSVIVEAALKSGTMTQAAYCKKAERPLFAVVPETVNNPLGLLSDGTLNMVQTMGAFPLTNKSKYPDMLAMLAAQKSLMHSLI